MHSQILSPLARLGVLARALAPALAVPLVLAPARAVAQAPAPVAEVVVTPEQLSLRAGARGTLAASAYDRQGNLISAARFTYRSADPSIARVQANGAVTALKAGATTIDVLSQGVRGTARVRVSATAPAARPAAPAKPAARPAAPPADTVARPEPARIDTAEAEGAGAVALTLDPPGVRLLPSEHAWLTPRALRENGAPAGRVALTWRSLDPQVASVDMDGLVVGVAPGRTTVRVEGPRGLTATAPVVVEAGEVEVAPARLVLAPGATDTLVARVPSQEGRVVRTGLVWRSSDTTVARVGPTGVVTAVAPGRAEAVATGFSQERRAPIVVHRLPAALVVSPRLGDTLQLVVRATRAVAARAEAADSTPIPEAAIVWSVGDSAVAAYDAAAGRLTAMRAGTTTLSATLAGFAPARWTVRVVPGRLRLDRARLGLGVGERAVLAARLVDERDSLVGPARELRWTSARAEIATVGADGAVTGRRAGRTTVTAATPWGQSETAEVFVAGQLLAAAHRGGSWGIYAARVGAAGAAVDSLAPVLVDSGATLINPAWSPDRTRIAFGSDRGGRQGIWVMDADGANARRLSGGAGADAEPAWAPDGERIWFASDRTGRSQIHSMRLDGSDVRAHTASAAGSVAPAVSPDGRAVAFASLRDGTYDLWLMNADGTGARALVAGDAHESLPRWLPNGDLLYVEQPQRRDRGARIVLLRQPAAAGAAGTALVTSEHPVTALAVSRDGRRIAYVVSQPAGGRDRRRAVLYVQEARPGAAPVAVPLRPGDQASHPAF